MHVFLTGPVQIGKSTLIAAALDALQPERLGGFRTVSAKPEADGSRPVYLHPAAAQDLLCGAQNRVGIRRPELGIASFPDAFETAGMDALKGAEDCDLVLIAAGFTGCEPYVADAFGVERTKRGTVADVKYATADPKVFACGDMRRGQSLVVWALREGRDAAAEVDKSLMGYTNL